MVLAVALQSGFESREVMFIHIFLCVLTCSRNIFSHLLPFRLRLRRRPNLVFLAAQQEREIPKLDKSEKVKKIPLFPKKERLTLGAAALLPLIA